MIPAIAGVISIYLAPLLALTSFILSLISLLSPFPATGVAHFKVVPKPMSDGPTLIMGPIGSCTRTSNAAPLNCLRPNLWPELNLSLMPANTRDLLTLPTQTTPMILLVSVIFFFIFAVCVTMFSLRDRFGKFSSIASNPMIGKGAAWSGLFAFMIGATTTFLLRVLYGKAGDAFNKRIAETANAPPLVAVIGNGFTMLWCAYAFAAPALICLLLRPSPPAPSPSKA